MKRYLLILLVPVVLIGCSGEGKKYVVSTFLDGSPKQVQFIEVNGQDTTVLKEIFYFQNGKKRLLGDYVSDSIYNGKWTGWYEDGTKNYEAIFENGVMADDWLVWDFDGNPMKKENYSMQVYDDGFPEILRFFEFDGDTIVQTGEIHFYDNHCRKTEGKVKSYKKHGRWIAWRRDGTKWSEGDFQYDVNHGWHTVYHENGRIFYEGEYRIGDRVGVWKIWNEEGDVVKETDYEK